MLPFWGLFSTGTSLIGLCSRILCGLAVNLKDFNHAGSSFWISWHESWAFTNQPWTQISRLGAASLSGIKTKSRNAALPLFRSSFTSWFLFSSFSRTRIKHFNKNGSKLHHRSTSCSKAAAPCIILRQGWASLVRLLLERPPRLLEILHFWRDLYWRNLFRAQIWEYTL